MANQARVVLYAMGGLAIADSNVWGSQAGGSRRPAHQIFISAAGPLAGFIFAAFTLLILVSLGVTVSFAPPNGGLIFWQLGISDTPTPFLVRQCDSDHPAGKHDSFHQHFLGLVKFNADLSA